MVCGGVKPEVACTIEDTSYSLHQGKIFAQAQYRARAESGADGGKGLTIVVHHCIAVSGKCVHWADLNVSPLALRVDIIKP